MIRINLMPFRAAREKEIIQKQLSIFLLLILFIIIALVYYDISFQQKIIVLKGKVAQFTDEKNKFDKKVRKVNKIKKQIKNYNQKISIIGDLETLRRKQVLFFNALPEILVPDKMWLTNLQYFKNRVNLKGIALDNKTVADFMINIEKSGFFNIVNLNQTAQVKIGSKLDLKKFEIVNINVPLEIKSVTMHEQEM